MYYNVSIIFYNGLHGLKPRICMTHYTVYGETVRKHVLDLLAEL